jgi:hypothetical protein
VRGAQRTPRRRAWRHKLAMKLLRFPGPGKRIRSRWSCFASPGPGTAAAPTAAALWQEPDVACCSLTGMDNGCRRAIVSWKGGLERPAARLLRPLRRHARARLARHKCTGLGPAVRDVHTPTLPGIDGQLQRDWSPKLEFCINLGTYWAESARQRRLETPLMHRECPSKVRPSDGGFNEGREGLQCWRTTQGE